VLPWFGPNPKPADSVSCRYGFNNFLAWVWVALMLGLAALYRIFRRGPGGRGYLEIAISNILPDGSKRVPNKPLLISFFAVLLVTLFVVIGWFAYLPYAYFGETKLFISRIEAMVMGLAPYRDFNFTYGPALLYLPYFVYRLFEGWFSIEQVYGFALAVNWCAGLYLAYYIVSRLSGAFARCTVFLILVIPCLNISLGLNYTLLRFTLPMASLIGLHRFVLRAPGRGERQEGEAGTERAEGRGQRTEIRASSRPLLQGVWIGAAGFLVPLINFAVSP